MQLKSLAPAALWARMSREGRIGLIVFGALLALAIVFLTLASRSTPGESLYPVKRGVEDLRLSLITTKYGLAQYSLKRSRERLNEARELFKEGKKQQARDTIREQDFYLEKAYEYAEFLEEQKDVDKITDAGDKLHVQGLEIRQKTSPAFSDTK